MSYPSSENIPFVSSIRTSRSARFENFAEAMTTSPPISGKGFMWLGFVEQKLLIGVWTGEAESSAQV